jgi:ATP-dependent 26S proteasome regulatory subunit
MATFLVPKSSKIFRCEKCNYTTSRKSQYERHLTTRKHVLATNGNIFSSKSSTASFQCECGKSYKDRSGLYKHKKKCTSTTGSIESKEETTEPTMEFLVNENLEMKKMMIDLCHKIEPSNINNHTNINSHNKFFNIQVFLNEDCKDAMNMTEFIESIQLSIEDVEKIGLEGQTQALSNILSNKLNEMDIFKRPVHCSDAKKEIIYVKDEDKWEQEKKDKPKLKKALDKIAKESLCKVPEMAPDGDKYVKTISEILKDPREDKKILSEVSKGLLVK